MPRINPHPRVLEPAIAARLPESSKRAAGQIVSSLLCGFRLNQSSRSRKLMIMSVSPTIGICCGLCDLAIGGS